MTTRLSHSKYDVAIVGAGPGGAASALYLLQAGLKPLILDKEPFPRYHIGESLTGECGACLKELGLELQLDAARFPIKSGVTVYGEEGKNSFWVPVQKRNAENQLEPSSTWQVRRSEFDQILLDAAIERGADFVPGEAILPLTEGDAVTGVRFRTPQGAVEDVLADVVVDASGQSTFLANRSYLTSDKELGRYDKQLAIFSQVTGAIRDPGDAAGNTLIFYKRKHHWAWFIPLDDEVVSVGVVVPSDYFKAQKCSKEEFLQRELRTLNPELSKRVPVPELVEPIHTASNYSYHVKQFTGKGFLCVGDAHRFVDPIFSFGVYFGVKEAQFATQAICQYLNGETRDLDNPFGAYQRWVENGQDIIQSLLDSFWEFPMAFLYFVHFKYRDDMIDLFAGRIYGDEIMKSPGVQNLRKLLSRQSALESVQG